MGAHSGRHTSGRRSSATLGNLPRVRCVVPKPASPVPWSTISRDRDAHADVQGGYPEDRATVALSRVPDVAPTRATRAVAARFASQARADPTAGRGATSQLRGSVVFVRAP